MSGSTVTLKAEQQLDIDFVKLYEGESDADAALETAFERVITDLSKAAASRLELKTRIADRARSAVAIYLVNKRVKAIHSGSCELQYTRNGRPFIWRLDDDVKADVDVSISHDGTHVATAILHPLMLHTACVGVDIMENVSFAFLEDLSTLSGLQRVFHPEELRFVAEAGAKPDQIQRACLIWTLKEACVKAFGCGVTSSLKDQTASHIATRILNEVAMKSSTMCTVLGTVCHFVKLQAEQWQIHCWISDGFVMSIVTMPAPRLDATFTIPSSVCTASDADNQLHITMHKNDDFTPS